MKSLGERLKEIRLAGDVTQVALAKRAGISQKRVSDMERGIRGENRSPLDTLERMVKALGCRIDLIPR